MIEDLRERLRAMAAKVPPEVALAMCFPDGLPALPTVGHYRDVSNLGSDSVSGRPVDPSDLTFGSEGFGSRADFRSTGRTEVAGPCVRSWSSMLDDRYSALAVAIFTNEMRRFARASLWLKHAGEARMPNVLKLVALLLSIPCFKVSHLFFKLAYLVNCRRLRRLSGQNLFLEFYDGRVATGRVVDILQSLRQIKHRLERTDTAKNLRNHSSSPLGLRE